MRSVVKAKSCSNIDITFNPFEIQREKDENKSLRLIFNKPDKEIKFTDKNKIFKKYKKMKTLKRKKEKK